MHYLPASVSYVIDNEILLHIVCIVALAVADNAILLELDRVNVLHLILLDFVGNRQDNHNRNNAR